MSNKLIILCKALFVKQREYRNLHYRYYKYNKYNKLQNKIFNLKHSFALQFNIQVVRDQQIVTRLHKY